MTDVQNDEVAVTVEGQAVVVNGVAENVAENVDSPTVLDDAAVTEPVETVIVNPFRPAGKAARNMSAHDKIFRAADLVADDFYNLSGREASVSVSRSATLRGARVTFDVDVSVDGVQVLAASRNGLTMEESLTFLAGMSAILAVVAALSPENEAIDLDALTAAA